MKLKNILDSVNSFEKNSFLKILESIISNNPNNLKQIEEITSYSNNQIKNIDSLNIAKVYQLVSDEYCEFVKDEFKKASSQIDILVNIISRDGNCLMSREWFGKLYEKEIKKIKKDVKEFQNRINNNNVSGRNRDYIIYKNAVNVAYHNNPSQDFVITSDEQSILNELAKDLDLSNEEISLINYSILELNVLNIDDAITQLKDIGVIFYSKKQHQIYVPDSTVRILRKVLNKQVADKYFRRVLKSIREPLINLISRKHNIDWKQSYETKVEEIIRNGISFSGVLLNDIHKEDTLKSDINKFINDLIDTKLNIEQPIKGRTAEEKIDNLIEYFETIDKDENLAISLEGYDKMLRDLDSTLPKLNSLVKQEFELQTDNSLLAQFLLDYNIKPRDVLYLISDSDLKMFCENNGIKKRGYLIENILEAYTDADNLFIENYENIGNRDAELLRINGLKLSSAEYGIKFEEITKKIFEELGLNVAEDIRKKINTSKDKIDIILGLEDDSLIIVECKTSKDKFYNKYSSISRQIKSYIKLAEKNGYKVPNVILVAPEFSDDFVKECGLEYELNLSLLTANTLKSIYDGFKDSKLKELPIILLQRDLIIKEDRILKAIQR